MSKESDPQGGYEVVRVAHYRVDFEALAYEGLRLALTGQKKGLLVGIPKEDLLKRYSKSNKELKKSCMPFNNGGKTEVTIRDVETGEEFVGVSYCSMSEQFSYKKGRNIATGRALKLALNS